MTGLWFGFPNLNFTTKMSLKFVILNTSSHLLSHHYTYTACARWDVKKSEFIRFSPHTVSWITLLPKLINIVLHSFLSRLFRKLLTILYPFSLENLHLSTYFTITTKCHTISLFSNALQWTTLNSTQNSKKTHFLDKVD